MSRRTDAQNPQSYLHGASEVPLRGDTIGQMWADIVAQHGDREAIVSRHQGLRWTYADLSSRVDTCAQALIASGVQKGDRVGIWSPNNAEWVVVQLATALIGAILVNVNPSYGRTELEYALRQSGTSLLIAAAGFKGSDYRELLVGIDAPALRETVILEDDWERLLQRATGSSQDAVSARQTELSSDDPINIQYTSGTTGHPKGATLSHHNILNNGFFVGETCGYSTADRVCLPVPYYHCFGMVLGTLAIVTHGACAVLPSEAFLARAVLEAVEEEGCTALYGVPTMFIAELAEPSFQEHDLTTLRTGIMAGSPCPTEVMKRVKTDMHMDQVTICYGMTETSPVSTQTTRWTPIEKQVATVGQVHPHVEIKIINPVSGQTVERGETGELCTRGYSVMLGYWNDEEATRAAIDSAHWMHTGDLATVDSEGYVNIVGRIKDMIIRGGENIYPREIEEFLFTHPAIADVQVCGIPNQRYGEEVCAWIIANEDAELSEEQVRDFCQDKIAHFKIPRYIRFVDGFPLTVTGKVQKYRMRELEIAERQLEQLAAETTA